MAFSRLPTPIEPLAEKSFGFKAWQNPIVARQSRPHTHADVEWNLLVSGSARYFMSGRFQSLTPGCLAIFWGAIPHALVDFEPDSVMIWVTLPIAWLVGWDLGDKLMSRMLSGELICEPRPQENSDVDLLSRWVDDMEPTRRVRRTAALLEVQARLHRLDDSLGQIRNPPVSRLGGDQIERISAFVGSHFRQGFSTADVADAVGLHPNYVMTLFKRRCGMSLWEYVTQLRIGHAQRQLLMSDKKVTAIALESGFGSPSRFYDAFQRIVGRTPRQYRQSLQNQK